MAKAYVNFMLYAVYLVTTQTNALMMQPAHGSAVTVPTIRARRKVAASFFSDARVRASL